MLPQNRSSLRSLALLGAFVSLLSTGVPRIAAAAVSSSPHDFDSLVRRFAAPAASSGILKIIHGWPDAAEAQNNLIARLQRQGFGGVVCNVSFEQYLESPAKWSAFERAVNAAHTNGLAMWLYDERGYPSANAGGLVLRDHPEWEARGLLIADAVASGGEVRLELPPGRLVLAGAYPLRQQLADLGEVVDLTKFLQGNQLTWPAPAGQRWQVLVITEDRLYEGTHADQNLHEKLPYPNLLMAEPTARFLDVTHGRYAAHLGNDLGRWFEATFTDEPSLMSCFLKPKPYRVVPWSPTLPREFQRRRGYSLEPLLPALVVEAGSPSRQARHDFWLTVGELVSENFFGQIQTWCRQHGIPSGGHLLMEESLAAHVPFYGDFFRCLRRMDAPGIDCLTSLPPDVPWHIARLAGSAAELDGGRFVMCETSDHAQVWRPPGDARPKRVVTEAEIRGTCHRLMVAGVNRITSYYSFGGLNDAALNRLNAELARCGDLLLGSRTAAEIALLYPAESAMAHFVPSRHWAREAEYVTRIESTWRAAAEGLFESQRDFTFVDGRTLTEAKVSDGDLALGALHWRVVILPMTDTLPIAAWNNLELFVHHGGVVIALGALPANSEKEFPSARVRYLAADIFGRAANAPHVQAHPSGGAGIYLPPGSEGLLPLVLRGVLEPDVEVYPPKSPVRVTHRRQAGREFYFLINDSGNAWTGRATFSALGVSHRWWTGTGRVETNRAGHAVELSLGPYEAAFVNFAGWRRPGRHRLDSGQLPRLVQRPLALEEPTVVCGEFVRPQVQRFVEAGAPTGAVWRATGALTKDQVDTFLFLRFGAREPLNLSDADCLVLDTRIPEEQRTPNHLLVIVQEKGGGDFIAEAGRSLGAPGMAAVFVPLNRFKLAGWSKDGDGEMDWSRVADVRVGWGGYLGRAGETVEFSVAAPACGRVKPPMTP